MPRQLMAILASALLLCHSPLNGTPSISGTVIMTGLPDTTGIIKYKAPFPSRENLPVGPRGLRWVTKSELAFFNVSLMTGTDVMQADLLKLNHRIFNVSAMSVIDGHDPFAAKYFLPFGVKASLLNARYFNVTAGADMYLFPFGANGTGRGTYYTGDYNFGSYSDELEYSFSQFIDARISIEASPVVGVKAFIGCRVPVTPYSIYNLTIGEMTYERGSTFVYAGISGSLQLSFPFNEAAFYRCYNERDNRIRKARRSDSPTAYESIIKTYPGTPYADEASQRLEYIFYSRAMLGNLAGCEEYLSRYPEGKYRAEVTNRRAIVIEDLASAQAIKGSLADAENYLKAYPEGRYALKVREKRNKILDELELKAYQAALSGTFDSCDAYLQQFPYGKHLEEVRGIRAEKYHKAEEEYYQQAVNGNFIECDRYLELYPEGRYLAEVSRMRTLSHRNSENVYYRRAADGDLGYCEAYLRYYPAGQHRDEIGKLRDTLFGKLMDDVSLAADLYSTILLEHLIKTDSSFFKKSDYVISPQIPFILFINQSVDSSLILLEHGDYPGGNDFNTRSLGAQPTVFAENASMQRWEINSTPVDKDGNQVTSLPLVSDKNLLAPDMSGLKSRIETGQVFVKGWIKTNSVRFEMVDGVIIYRERTKPGEFRNGSRCIANGLDLVCGNGEWSIVH